MTPIQPPKPKLLDWMWDRIRLSHYSIRTEMQYLQWIKWFIVFHDNRHPIDIGAAEVEAFLTHLAVDGNVAASTQNQALSVILFLYRDVLGHMDGVHGWYVFAGYVRTQVSACSFGLGLAV